MTSTQRPEPPPEPVARPEIELETRGETRAETFWGWLRSTARLWGFFLFVLVAIVVFRQVILPFVIGLVLTYMLAPLLRVLCATRVAGRQLPRAIWLLAVYSVLVGLLGLFFVVFVPRLGTDLKRIVREAPQLTRKLQRSWLPPLERWLATTLGEVDETPPLATPSPAAAEAHGALRLRHLADGSTAVDTRGLELELVRQGDQRWILRGPSASASGQRAAPQGAVRRHLSELVSSSETSVEQLLGWVQQALVGLLHAISGFILVLMISAFLLLDTDRILQALRNLVPRVYHRDFDQVVSEIDRALSGAIRGQLVICLVNALLTGLGLALISVKYTVLLALLAGLMSLIPIFGSILSTIPIVVVALVSGSEGLDLTRGLLAFAWIVGIHLVEANVLNPKILGSATRLHPVLVIFAVVAGQNTGGAAGALLAVPIVSAGQALFIYLRARTRSDDRKPLPEASAP
ncbi:MAG: AI-2E family transporter [Proteobacteria bacterium]|nr:AI-2E family transporter [Pseudomonadota bacterium]